MGEITKVYLSFKKSGNIIVSEFNRKEWELIGEYSSPIDLKLACNCYPEKEIILKEYLRSQNKRLGKYVDMKDCLRIFGIPANKINVESYSNIK